MFDYSWQQLSKGRPTRTGSGLHGVVGRCSRALCDKHEETDIGEVRIDSVRGHTCSSHLHNTSDGYDTDASSSTSSAPDAVCSCALRCMGQGGFAALRSQHKPRKQPVRNRLPSDQGWPYILLPTVFYMRQGLGDPLAPPKYDSLSTPARLDLGRYRAMQVPTSRL